MNASDTVQLDVVLRSASGQSILDKAPGDNRDLAQRFTASKETQAQALRALTELGFEILAATPLGVSIAGPAQLVRRVFGKDEPVVPPSLKPWIDAVRFPPRGTYLASG
jgi:hypothetical protein